jgi:hypothetical protein
VGGRHRGSPTAAHGSASRVISGGWAVSAVVVRAG